MDHSTKDEYSGCSSPGPASKLLSEGWAPGLWPGVLPSYGFLVSFHFRFVPRSRTLKMRISSGGVFKPTLASFIPSSFFTNLFEVCNLLWLTRSHLNIILSNHYFYSLVKSTVDRSSLDGLGCLGSRRSADLREGAHFKQ